MLDPVSRQLVEAIRSAKSVRLVFNEGTDDEQVFVVDERMHDIRQFRRNLRLTVQDYINECQKKYNGSRKFV